MPFEFAHPWMLLLLIPAATIVLVQIRRSGRAVRLPSDDSAFPVSRTPRWVPQLADWTGGAFLLSLVPVLAGPRSREADRQQEEMTNVVICLDISGSMLAEFGAGGMTRFDVAAEQVRAFAERRRGDAFGLVVFGSHPVCLLPPTQDLKALKDVSLIWKPGEDEGGLSSRTFIVPALQASIDLLIRRPEGDRMVVLVTDGDDETLDREVIEMLAKRVTDCKVQLNFISISITSPQDLLTELAARSGGSSSNAADADALVGIFQRIDAMQRASFKLIRSDPVDAPRPWLLAALACALLHGFVLLCGWRWTPW